MARSSAVASDLASLHGLNSTSYYIGCGRSKAIGIMYISGKKHFKACWFLLCLSRRSIYTLAYLPLWLAIGQPYPWEYLVYLQGLQSIY